MQILLNLVRKGGVMMRERGLLLLSVLIAIILWFQVHGQGQGSVSLDVPLQVRGLPQNMAIVNDLPDHVRITVGGLQARLSSLASQDVRVPLDASELNEPGVIERSVKVSDVRLPTGLRIMKLQPDKVELQIDRVVTRSIRVKPRFELPGGWKVLNVRVKPAEVQLSGPEVWLDALPAAETTAIRPEVNAGQFEVRAGVQSPSGKAIRLVDAGVQVTIQGVLVHKPGTK